MAVSQLQARSILSLSKADIAMQLFREQFTDASILSDFTCGLQVMDDFIHHNLQSYLDAYSCTAYCLYSEEGEIVAFFVIPTTRWPCLMMMPTMITRLFMTVCFLLPYLSMNIRPLK